ncbi:MAG: hypothetical protein VR68_00530 [Peptococcaceae bacterium BRH_c4a]|nr:MAG: hypothetical protein VR68_00530 [Peptococcaceae bacterium BRH_c4a]
MKEKILNVNYIIDNALSLISTKMVYDHLGDDDLQHIHFEINIGNQYLISNPSNDTEIAVINLQKVLPANVSIACCQSCRYGNFCPYGDNDNEIFCLKDMTPNNKFDVCEIFSNDYDLARSKCKILLGYCADYMPISHDEYYTYNDWGL